MRSWCSIVLVLTLVLFGMQHAAWSKEPAVPEDIIVIEEDEGLQVDEDVLEAKGTLVEIDTTIPSLVLSDGKQEVTYVIDPDAVIWLGEDEVTLVDLKADDKISLDYFTDEKGTLVTDWVEAERA